MQNGIASHLHFLTDVQGNMYTGTYASHLRYHANDGTLWETQRKIIVFKLINQLMYGQEPFLGTEKKKKRILIPIPQIKLKNTSHISLTRVT